MERTLYLNHWEFYNKNVATNLPYVKQCGILIARKLYNRQIKVITKKL